MPEALVIRRRPRFSFTAFLRLTAVVLVIVLVLLRLRSAVLFLASGLAAIRYPYQMDFGEGVVITQVNRLLAGQAYGAVGLSPPYVVINYPPVFHMVAALAGRLNGNLLAAGRYVSFLSTLLTSLILGVITLRAARPGVARLPRILAGALAGLSFLSVSYTASWAPLMRVDMLAILLSCIGVLTFATQAQRGRRIYWCVLPFLLAMYTKQTAFAAPAACVLAAAGEDFKRSLRLGLLLVGTGLGIFLACNWFTDGQFFLQLVTANRNIYSWQRTLTFLDDVKRRYPIELAIAVVAAVSFLREWLFATAVPARDPRLIIRPVLGIYLITAFLVSLTVGKVGSEVNYLIELMAVACCCVAVAVADGFARDGVPVPGAAPPLTASLVAVLVPCLLLAPSSGLLRSPGIEWVEIPSPQDQQESARLMTMIRDIDGPVISEDLTLLFLAGKPVEYQPCDMSHLADQGRWDQSGFVGRINRQHYRLIVLQFDVHKAPDLGRFTPAMIEAIRSAYVPTERIAGNWIYVPRQGS